MPLSTALPTAFVAMIQELLPLEAEALLAALDEEPRVSVRLNASKCSTPLGDLPLATAVPWSAGRGYYLSSRPSFTADPRWHAGQYYVQEAASMTLSCIRSYLGDEALRALDLCAAPGGKSSLLLDLLPSGSCLISNEYVRSRAHILTENLQKWGSPYSLVTHTEASRLGAMRAAFDLILVDAPCSGEGMMRKEEEARRQWSPQLVAQCAQLQRKILEDIWSALHPGGLLVYSTCTLNRQEDEDQVSYLCETLGAEALPLPELERYVARSSLSPYPCYRMMPHQLAGEGLFLCLLRKAGTPEEDSVAKPKKTKGQKPRSAAPKPTPELQRWLREAESFAWRSPDEQQLYALPPALAALYDQLQALQIPILSAGVAVAEQKGRDWLPLPALALSQSLNLEAFVRCELSREEALRYLAGEALLLPSDTPRGFVLVCYEGQPLGFAKHLGNRTNNMYPQPWRIRQLAGVLRRLEETRAESDD